MPTLLNINCEVNGGNTGLPNCDTELGRVIGLIAYPRGLGFPILNLHNTLWNLLNAAAENNSPSARAYPIFPGFEVTESIGEDRTQATAAGTGNTKTLRDAKKGWTWTSWAGLCYYSSIESFNAKEKGFDFFLVTEDNQFIAINRNGLAQGLRFSDFFVSPYNERMDDTAAGFTISALIENTREWRKNLIVVVPSGGEELTSLMGLYDAQPVNLNAEPLPIAGTFDIGVTAGCGAGGSGATNLIPLYETVLEDMDNWTVTNATTGAVITVTSITASTDKSKLVFVMPTTSPYVAGEGVKFQLADHTTLDTAGMPGYEGKSVIVPNVV